VSTHEHSGSPGLHVTAAGREELARPTRGLSVWQRRLLQGLIAQGTVQGALAADAVLQRRPLEADLDRLIDSGLIRTEAKIHDEDSAIAASEAVSHGSGGGRRASVLVIVGIVAGSTAGAIGYMNSGTGSGGRHEAATTLAAEPSAAPAKETHAPVAAPLDLPAPAPASPRPTIAAPAEKAPAVKPEAVPAPRKVAVERAPAAPPSVPSAPASSIAEKKEAPPVAPAAIPALPAPTLAAAADIRPAEAPRPLTRTKPVIDPNKACAQLEYPPAALRAAQTGIVTLSFLIDVDGQVIESKIDRSSGYRALDEAARRGLSRCKFIPAKLGNQPEQAWGKLEYEWRLD
jgi:protein TonB